MHLRRHNFEYILGLALLPLFIGCGQKASTKMMGPSGESEFGSMSGGNANYSSIPGLGKADQQTLATQNQELSQVAPQSGMPDFSAAVNSDFKELEEATKRGEDTTQLRYALMGKILTDCAEKVAEYTPQPGETYLGQWGHRCVNTNIYSTWDLSASYPGKDSAGIPLGKPNYSYKGVVFGEVEGTPVAGGGSGSFSAGTSGNGNSQGNWIAYAGGKAYPWTWNCSLKDTPQAATGNCVTPEQAQYCYSAPGALMKSKNPIPEKYKEAMKKLGACYRKGIVLVSPILWKYIASLPQNSQKVLMQALFLQ